MCNTCPKAKLQEEVDNPFRKVRQFVYIAVGAAGTIGTFTSLPVPFSATQVGRGGETAAAAADVSQNVVNLVIDVAAVVTYAAFWRKDASDEAHKVAAKLAAGFGEAVVPMPMPSSRTLPYQDTQTYVVPVIIDGCGGIHLCAVGRGGCGCSEGFREDGEAYGRGVHM